MPALTLFDNVLLVAQASRSPASPVFGENDPLLLDSVMETLAQFRLENRAFERAATPSHGQQQWLEMAMALATRPKLLFLDEPTAGMSVEERRLTGNVLQSLRHRLSIVIVEHDLDFVRDLCDRMTVMDQGKVMQCGTCGRDPSQFRRAEDLRRV